MIFFMNLRGHNVVKYHGVVQFFFPHAIYMTQTYDLQPRVCLPSAT